MRISDWSSDVCSSDLSSPPGLAPAASPGQPISSPTSPTWRPRHDTPSFSLARLTARRHRPRPSAQPVADHGRAGIGAVGRLRPDELCAECAPGGSRAAAGQQSDHLATERGAVADQPGAQPREPAALLAPADPARSEEHTSELQSLMRTSYAVF